MLPAVTRVLRFVDGVNRRVGRTVAWLATLLVVAQFIVVGLRYIFGVGSLMLQESVVYMFGILFMAGAGYTLLYDGHVRVDIFYRDASKTYQALINLIGNLCFLLPVCIIIWVMGWPYVAASLAVLEGSRETSGLPGIFLLKSMILVFATLLMLQAIAESLRAFVALYSKTD